MKHTPTFVLFGLFVLLNPYAPAEVKLGRLFADHMVLQRGVPIKVWGTADPGENVSISIADQSKSSVAGGDGKWSVKLGPLSLGAPLTLTVQGNNKLTFQDVLVGDVWVASGQSNMGFPLRDASTAQEAIAHSADPQFRMINASGDASLKPVDDFRQGEWQVADPQVVGSWSAVAFFFGQELRRDLKIPIGIIHSSSGGTDAEAWVSTDAMLATPEFHQISEEKIQQAIKLPADLAAFGPDTQRWIAANAEQDAGNQGEKEGWAATNFDDSSWKTVKVPLWVRDNGMKGGGVVWWRKSLDFPAGMPTKDGILKTGITGGVLQVYFNGELLKEIDPPPAFSGRQRLYSLPGSLLHPGMANVVAVRQYTLTSEDGFMNSTKSLELSVPPELLSDDLWKFRIEQAFPEASADALRTLPRWPDIDIRSTAGGLFNAFIYPMIQYPIKGVVWYQGENNVPRAHQYVSLLSLLIHDWRTKWSESDLPFVIEQIANYGNTNVQPGPSREAPLREAQLKVSQTVPHTALAVAIDIGVEDIHPKDKVDVGKRTALVARTLVYGEKVESSGPIYAGMQVEGNSIRLAFTHGGGLMAKDGPLNQFAIAGADQKFVWADAKIDGDTIVVSSPSVSQPVAVRYAWNDNPPNCNLYNAAGLPASPFRTDDWPYTYF